MKYPARRLFYCAIVRKDERRTKSPMKNFIPYFYLSYISIRNYLKICSLFPTKRSNFIMLLYSPCLARGIKGWMHQRISEMRFERFRSIFKPIFFPFFLLSWFHRNGNSKRHKLDLSPRKSSSNFNRSPDFRMRHRNARLFTVCINASFERKQFCRSGAAWRKLETWPV